MQVIADLTTARPVLKRESLELARANNGINIFTTFTLMGSTYLKSVALGLMMHNITQKGENIL